MANGLAQIMTQVSNLQSRLYALETTPQLANSSLDNASLPVKDADGAVVAVIGKQTDGTYAYNVVDGPVPPLPSGVTVEDGVGHFTVHWAGTFVPSIPEDIPVDPGAVPPEVPAPADLATVVIHAGTTEDFTANAGNAVLALTTAEPTTRTVNLGQPGTFWVRATTLSLAGKRSEATEPLQVVVSPLVLDSSITEALQAEREIREQALADADAALAELDEKINNLPAGGGAGITTSETDPTAETPGKAEGDLWWTVSGDGPITAQWEWTGTEWVRREVSSEVITNLDVAKLTATQANISEAVIGRLWTDIFTARKITGDEIAANSIAAEKISGGSFSGETFTGGSFFGTAFSGASFTTLDGPEDRQGISISDAAVVEGTASRPGIRFNTPTAADTAKMPAIFANTFADGSTTNTLFMRSGTNSAGEFSRIIADATYAQMTSNSMSSPLNYDHFSVGRGISARAYAPGGYTDNKVARGQFNSENSVTSATISAMHTSEVYTAFKAVSVPARSSYAAEARFSISGRTNVAFTEIAVKEYTSDLVISNADKVSGNSVSLTMTKAGAANLTSVKSGVTTTADLTKVREWQDTGWINVTAASTVNVGEQLAYRIINGTCWWRGIVYGKNSGSTLAQGYTNIFTGAPVACRPISNQGRPAYTDADMGLFLQMVPDGRMEVWCSRSTVGWINLSPMNYPIG